MHKRSLYYHLSKTCKSMARLKQIIAKIIIDGVDANTSSYDILLSFAATATNGDIKFASILYDQYEDSLTLFNSNSMLRGLVSNARRPREALRLFIRMNRRNLVPDNLTFPLVIKACSILVDIDIGKAVHSRVFIHGFQMDSYVVSGLIAMYSDFGEIDYARQVFDEMIGRDVVSWNSMIGGYVKCGNMLLARLVFDDMDERNVGSYNVLLGGYAKFGRLDEVCRLFEEMTDRDVVSWNTIIGAHARLGLVKVTREFFDRAPRVNVATWSSMISGFAQSNRFMDALDVFKEMLDNELRPNQSILVSVLSSCSHLGALEQGIWVHSYIKRIEFEMDDLLGSVLIDMYAKCGMLRGAKVVFDALENKDVCSWTTMINAFAMHGHAQEALEGFNKMQEQHVKPNKVTILAALCACSHAGLVQKGQEIFEQMRSVYSIIPQIEHYTCMIDILSRRNLMYEAIELLKSMPMEPDAFVWGALLAGLRANDENGIVCEQELAKTIAKLEPKGSGPYVLMSNIFAASDSWNGVERMRKMMEGSGVRKKPGCSLIEVDGVVHEFLANSLNKQSQQMYDMLYQINKVIKMNHFT